MNPMMEWSRGLTCRLIEQFREKRILWDPTHKEFKNRIKKHDAWAELAANMHMDTGEVEKKMRILMGQFQRELRKGKCGDGAYASYKSKWIYFRFLSFLRNKNELRYSFEMSKRSQDFFPAQDTTVNKDFSVKVQRLSHQEKQLQRQQQQKQQQQQQPQKHQQQTNQQQRHQQQPQQPPQQLQQQPQKQPQQQSQEHLQKQSQQQPHLSIENGAGQTANDSDADVDDSKVMLHQQNQDKSKNSTIIPDAVDGAASIHGCNSIKTRDEFDVFGEYVAYTLRNLKHKSTQSYAKFEIGNVLYRSETDDQRLMYSTLGPLTLSNRSTPIQSDATTVSSNQFVERTEERSADDGPLESVLIKSEYEYV